MTCNRFRWVAMLLLAGSTGCAMCDNCQDGTYPAFGGKWQRDNPFSGRVGSLFDPAGVQVAGQATLTLAEPTLAEDEAAETGEDTMPSESPAPSETAEEPPKSVLDQPPEQDAPAMEEAETTEPETVEDAKPAKPAADRDAPDAGLQLPAMPFETPKTEDPKEGGANLLPPLDLLPKP